MAPNLQEPMLIRGDIDGAFVFTITSWFNLIANRQDPANDYNWFQFEDYGMDLYSNGLMVSRALLTDNPEAVAGLVRAVNRATHGNRQGSGCRGRSDHGLRQPRRPRA